MLIDEKMLAPYRGSQGEDINLAHLPNEWFSDAEDALGAEWCRQENEPPSAVTPVIAFTRWVPRLYADCEWHALTHQSGGYSTNANLMIATAPIASTNIKPFLDKIATAFYYAETGHFDRKQMIVSFIVKYVDELKALGLDCEATWRLLEEAMYPVDATQSNLDRIFSNAPHLSQITRWGENPPRYITDPAILFLTSNSD